VAWVSALRHLNAKQGLEQLVNECLLGGNSGSRLMRAWFSLHQARIQDSGLFKLTLHRSTLLTQNKHLGCKVEHNTKQTIHRRIRKKDLFRSRIGWRGYWALRTAQVLLVRHIASHGATGSTGQRIMIHPLTASQEAHDNITSPVSQ